MIRNPTQLPQNMPTYSCSDVGAAKLNLIASRATVNALKEEIQKETGKKLEKEKQMKKLKLELEKNSNESHLEMVKTVHLLQLESHRTALCFDVDPLMNTEGEINDAYAAQTALFNRGKGKLLKEKKESTNEGGGGGSVTGVPATPFKPWKFLDNTPNSPFSDAV